MPVMPQNDAGWRIEPPVSVPVAAGARRAAPAPALPPGEAPGRGLRAPGVGPGDGPRWPQGATAEFSLDEPIAISSQLSLPSVTAPACASWRTTVASNGDW